MPGELIGGTEPDGTTPASQQPTETTEPTSEQTEPVNDPASSEAPESTAAPSGILWGDANCDGVVDIMDVIAVNKYLLGSSTLSADGKTHADVDGQNGVDTTDSLNILKLVVEMLTQADMPVK